MTPTEARDFFTGVESSAASSGTDTSGEEERGCGCAAALSTRAVAVSRRDDRLRCGVAPVVGVDGGSGWVVSVDAAACPSATLVVWFFFAVSAFNRALSTELRCPLRRSKRASSINSSGLSTPLKAAA